MDDKNEYDLFNSILTLLSRLLSLLQTTREAAANMFRGCLGETLRCTRITYTRFKVWTIFSVNIFREKIPLILNFTTSSVKWFEVQDTRNLSHKVITAM